ncbi:MAG: 2-oxoacid:acceptor oxidoreductase subunit alpha [Candidatus Heimdallarchaeota archaeon]|nr:2-oxoacid:acceptor oxidoreductase subunit alpha [Candidatus Heimdallarchaeota archaeon]
MNATKTITEEASIVLCGAAGLGIQTVEDLLITVLKKSGYHLFATKEYMSRVRGGLNSTEIRVSQKPVKAFVDRVDLFFVFSPGAVARHKNRLSPETIIVGEAENISLDLDKEDFSFVEIPLTEEAKKIGNKVYTNSIAAGVIAGLLDVDLAFLDDYFQERFSSKGEEVVSNNKKAARVGYDYAEDLEDSGRFVIDIPQNSQLKDQIVLSGTEAVSIGAIAGGCNFVCAYPMSPSTGVLTFLAQHKEEFDIIVEQAEDEIAAINAIVGAWYVGGRGLVTTAGDGFSLMTEGISLAGVTEMPVVAHVGQRPGPAVGLPTRTCQEDLNLVLYSGQGEFPRIIFTPGTIEDAFYLTQKAFNLADKFQVPVFILTDHYLLNSFYTMDAPSIEGLKIKHYITETAEDYKRYAFTDDGISPRGIPGGKGLIGVDSHEHDQEGHITEDLESVRKKMVEKRFKKLALLKEETILPQLLGNKDYETLVIAWGSNYHLVKEAIDQLARDDLAFLHFNQVHPLAEETKKYLEQAKRLIVVENNYTSQFGELLRMTFGIDLDHRIRKYIGLPFSVEELTTKLAKILEEK